MEFYQTEVGKVLAHGVHENNSSVGQIKNIIYLIRGAFDNGEYLTIGEMKQYLDMLESAAKKSQDGMDYVYENIKKWHESNK